MKAGVPTTQIIPFGEVVLDPDQVNISSTAATATTFRFQSPVYVMENVEYALVVKSDLIDYKIINFISCVIEIKFQ